MDFTPRWSSPTSKCIPHLQPLPCYFYLLPCYTSYPDTSDKPQACSLLSRFLLPYFQGNYNHHMPTILENNPLPSQNRCLFRCLRLALICDLGSVLWTLPILYWLLPGSGTVQFTQLPSRCFRSLSVLGLDRGFKQPASPRSKVPIQPLEERRSRREGADAVSVEGRARAPALRIKMGRTRRCILSGEG